MKQSPSRWSKSSIVFTVVAVVALGSTIASSGLGRGAHGRFHEAQAKLAVECASAGDACAMTAPKRVSLIPEFWLADDQLREVSAAPKSRLRSDAVASLVSVLGHADHIDRARTLVGSLIAAKLFDGVADRIEADPELLDDPRLTAAIRRSVFASARRPLDAERLHALSVLATVPEQVPVRTIGFAESTTTQAMKDVDVALHEMEASALTGDLKACEAASQKPKGLAKQVTVGASICKSAARIVESGHRLQRLQIRAAARSRHPSAKTARASLTL